MTYTHIVQSDYALPMGRCANPPGTKAIVPTDQAYDIISWLGDSFIR